MSHVKHASHSPKRDLSDCIKTSVPRDQALYSGRADQTTKYATHNSVTCSQGRGGRVKRSKDGNEN